MAMTEHDIQSLIQIELSKRGYFVTRQNVGKVRMADGRWFDTGLPVGFPDLVAYKNGNAYFIEVKNAKGRTSKQQDLLHDALRNRYNMTVGVARSVEDALQICNETP